MRTIAVVNQKGGTGKTTTTVCLGAALAGMGKRVLLIDLDPQYSTTTWLATRPVGRGVFELFDAPEETALADLVQQTATDGLWLVGASTWLIGVETILRDKIAELEPGRFDYVLVDCPPTLGVLTVNALTAAPEVIVPVECHVMGLQGLAQLVQTVERVRKRLNPALRIAGIVPCRLDQRTNHGPETVAKLRERFPGETFRTAVRENVRLAECPSMGEPITAYAPASSGAEDYRALAGEVIEQELKEEYGKVGNS